MWGGVTIKTRGALPLSGDDLRRRLRVDRTGDPAEDAAEDATLEESLAAAVAEVEGPKGRGIALAAQVWTLALDRFPAEIVLPGWPVKGLSEIRYTDPEGQARTLDATAVRVILTADPARVVPAAGQSWPAVAAGRAVIEIDYSLGEADPADIDRSLVNAVAMLAGHYYENREATADGGQVQEVPLGARDTLARYARGAAG